MVLVFRAPLEGSIGWPVDKWRASYYPTDARILFSLFRSKAPRCSRPSGQSSIPSSLAMEYHSPFGERAGRVRKESLRLNPGVNAANFLGQSDGGH